MSMEIDIYAEYSFGKIALKKFKSEDSNFRLFCAGIVEKGLRKGSMSVSGAVFRRAKSGAKKGLLCKIIPGTTRTVHVTIEEIREYEARMKIPDTGKTEEFPATH